MNSTVFICLVVLVLQMKMETAQLLADDDEDFVEKGSGNGNGDSANNFRSYFDDKFYASGDDAEIGRDYNRPIEFNDWRRQIPGSETFEDDDGFEGNGSGGGSGDSDYDPNRPHDSKEKTETGSVFKDLSAEDRRDEREDLRFGEFCTSIGPYCDSTKFTCLHNVCKCYPGSEYDHVLKICTRKVTYYFEKEVHDICSEDAECKDNVCHKDGDDLTGICIKCAHSLKYDHSLRACVQIPGHTNTLGSDSECATDEDCQKKEFGVLSRCNSLNRKCECWDTKLTLGGPSDTGLVDGKCYYKRKINQTCTQKAECVLGHHRQSGVDCLVHKSYNGEKVCQCTTCQTATAAACGYFSVQIVLTTLLCTFIVHLV